MSAAATIARRAPVLRPTESATARDLTTPLRVIAFAALAAYVGSAWVAMVADPPSGRTTLVIVVMVAAATAMSLPGDRRIPRLAATVLAAATVLIAVALSTIAIGLPARLVLPWHWGELAGNLGTGFGGLWTADYPYTGSTGWTRLVLLLGLPAVLGVSLVLAFWPTRAPRPGLRTAALVVLLVAYVTAMAVAPPGNALLHGFWLLLLVSAWLWLPECGPRRGALAAVLVACCGLVAIPVASALDGSRPWLDYRHWGSSRAVGPTEAFSWDQAYGPLTWPRAGRQMLQVESPHPYYWRAAVLDEFDGTSWVQSDGPGIAALQLPQGRFGQPTPRLDPAWIHDVTYTVDHLRSDLAVVAGTPLAPPRIDGLTVVERGLLLPSNRTLGEGDSYTVRSYIPDPTAKQMRQAPRRFPGVVARDTALTLPRGGSVNVPFWGATPGGQADQTLAASAYGGVYSLARRITAGHTTEYGAVKAIETYLDENYRYSEFAPIKRLALRTFLLHVHRGYCQHFSGAMALMLRMLGIPARVAAGFSPGHGETDGNYTVTDFDSHSWVEVYFNRIGWVTFDPTPPGSPAGNRTSGLGASIASPASSRADLKGDRRRKTNGTDPNAVVPGSSPDASGLPAWVWGGLAAALVAAAGALVLRRRRPDVDGINDAHLREVIAALMRLRSWDLRGTTLLTLERRLEAEGGPGAAAYLARLREVRYGGNGTRPPTSRDRRALRRDLAARRGVWGRLRAFAAVPPWGPPG
jgi:transglutaminase-like putative cysteine protease